MVEHPDYIPDADEAAGFGNRYICAKATGTDAITTADTMTLDLVTSCDHESGPAESQNSKIERGGESFM